MYSLIVSYPKEEVFGPMVEIDRSRFLEYTSDTIDDQLDNLSVEAKECLMAWPALLMQEGRGEETIHLVKITEIRDEFRKIKLTLTYIPGAPVLVNNALWKLRESLDIGDFEFNRNHWAVKDRDLLQALAENGYSYTQSYLAQFEKKSLPAPSRKQLLQARDSISLWSHTEIDDLLLEAGAEDLRAGRDAGSRRDRANAIIQFALDNPQAMTAENNLLSAFLARKASEADSSLPKSDDFEAATPQVMYPNQKPQNDRKRIPNRVFVVHGQNEAARELVVEKLTRVGLEAIVLHEQPNMGRHLLTKFIQEADLVTFAVVLMTDDDLGSRKDDSLAPRARQNVILELGYFLSHLGSPRVCALITPGLETPSDFDGIVYIRMDEGGTWKQELVRELRAARMPLLDVSE
jgi:predicted nucleotide-binding protein